MDFFLLLCTKKYPAVISISHCISEVLPRKESARCFAAKNVFAKKAEQKSRKLQHMQCSCAIVYFYVLIPVCATPASNILWNYFCKNKHIIMLILQFNILHFCPNFRICCELADFTAVCLNAAIQP